VDRWLNQIIEGDCLEVMKELPDKSVDMILCDLPYGTTACKWDTIIPIEPLWEQYKRLIKPNGAIVLTASQPFTSTLVMSNPKWFKYSLVWQKTTPTGFLNAKKMPLRTHEDILVFYNSLGTYNPQKTFGHKRKISTAQHKRNCNKTADYGEHGLTTYDSTERYPTSILTFSTDKQKIAVHPTQKPVALFEYLIRTYTNEGEIVLDNCMGSGTAAIASLNTGRFFIGIEKEPKYVEITRKRVEQAQAQQCLFGNV